MACEREEVAFMLVAAVARDRIPRRNTLQYSVTLDFTLYYLQHIYIYIYILV